MATKEAIVERINGVIDGQIENARDNCLHSASTNCFHAAYHYARLVESLQELKNHMRWAMDDVFPATESKTN